MDPARARATYGRIHQAINKGLVRACHDLSEGGLAVALAEMAFAGDLGAEISLADMPTDARHDYEKLFAESTSRFLIETPDPSRLDLGDVPHAVIGKVTSEKRLKVKGLLDVELAALKKAWKEPLAW
jgi:phosphoribosylformylglycinamidine synthase